jgi:hypothetical protein
MCSGAQLESNRPGSASLPASGVGIWLTINLDLQVTLDNG